MSPPRPYYDPSEEEADGFNDPQNRKRSSRACDQCRKTKSKCERSEPDNDNTPCKTCVLNNTPCTFLGPSYKRGPPKGYIHAIEQRWHHVESILGAILSSSDSRAQSVITDLRRDDMAREILNRVEAGPFGSANRGSSGGRNKADFFSSVLGSGREAGGQGGREGRARRQSRVSREIVSSNQDLAPLPEPTAEWQDRLSSRLAHNGSSYVGTNGGTSSTYGTYPQPQRRRIDGPTNGAAQPDWDGMYTMDGSDSYSERSHEEVENPEDGEDNVTALGHLSLDENHEIRFHGKASGLHLLGDRTDDRKEGGIWKLPMTGVWPPSHIRPARLIQEEDIKVSFPPMAEQDKLIELYFAYVHPSFPIIHRRRFMEEYEARRTNSPIDRGHTRSRSGSPYGVHLSKMLLLTMFSLAARYCDPAPDASQQRGMMWEIGCNYALDAREILNKVYHHSRTSTVQALLLLGLHEFGVGSMEHGWMLIGMGVRMAQDLGLNRAADRWQYSGGDLFDNDEKQIRKLIWWGCCCADTFTSVYMGRPVAVGESDFDTQFPEIPEEDNIEWRPPAQEPFKPKYQPSPGRVIACFCETASVVMLLAEIVKQIYPVRFKSRTPKRVKMAELERRLDQWYIDLPEALRYEPSSKRPVPPPHILVLHVRYWSAVLLLHRAFIPRLKHSMAPRGSGDNDTVALKAFDLCQSAASHISTIVTHYDECFGMKRGPLFLSSYVLSAGIMHVVTLNLRQNNVQATLGLRQCLVALEKMEVIWPSASRAKDLLSGANVQFQGILTPLASGIDRHKRTADDALGVDRSSELLQREALTSESQSMNTPTAIDPDTRVMARMLGLEVPGVQASTSYFPGYEWWPSIAPQQPLPMRPPQYNASNHSHQQGGYSQPPRTMPSLPALIPPSSVPNGVHTPVQPSPQPGQQQHGGWMSNMTSPTSPAFGYDARNGLPGIDGLSNGYPSYGR